MPSPPPPGPDLPLSCSSASSSEEEEEEEDHEEEDDDEEGDGVGEPEGDADGEGHVTPPAAKTLGPNSSPSFSSSSSGRENGSAGVGGKRQSAADGGVEGDVKRLRTSSTAIATQAVTQATPLSVVVSMPAQVQPMDSEMEKKAIVSVGEDSRRLFQRLWTDEDEIGLLNGFYEYSRRGNPNFHDMTPFYEQMKATLQFDFNKNQLVEKLRRLKKKYRNVVRKLSSGKDFAFKSAHDQLTFEISKKIWHAGYAPVVDDEEEPVVERKPGRGSRKSHAQAHQPVPPPSQPVADGGGTGVGGGGGGGGGGVAGIGSGGNCGIPSVHSVVEETVRSCLSPIFKELMYSAVNGPSHSGFGLGMNPLPLSFGGAGEFKAVGSDEKWRKQQILELEVYLKRIELVQEQIKLTLQELKSLGT
ncbi:unnamed protein product [Victoria cruziana]